MRKASKAATPTRIIQAFLAEIKSVDHSPRFQTIVTHGVLELLVNTLIEHRCKHGNKIIERTRDYPQSVKLVLLNETGLISDFYYKLLDAFRDLRNKAAHQAQFNLTPELLLPFKAIIASDRKAKLDDPRNFGLLCCEFIFGFWNSYVELFAPIFEPDLFNTKNEPSSDERREK